MIQVRTLKLKLKNNSKAEPEATKRKNGTEENDEVVPNDPKASLLTSLVTLLENISSSKEEWPEEALVEC